MQKRRILGSILSFVLVVAALCQCVAAQKIDSVPYPLIEYSYTTNVTSGTIRYICQDNTSGYFYKNYWGTWADKSTHECLTACISMDLSYVGVNVTPAQILDEGSGSTRPAYNWGGAVYSSIDFDTAFSNYLTGNGKYSPPIIHLNNYSTSGHYVLVIARKSDNEYYVSDPYQSNTWILTRSGSSFTYDYYGKSVTDSVSDAIQYCNKSSTVSQPSSVNLIFYINKTSYIVNGENKSMDVAPYMKSNRTYLPARFVAEALNATVTWDEATKTVLISDETNSLKLTIGSKTAYLNGAMKTLDVAPEITNGRTCLPIRFVAESLGAKVMWNQNNQSVLITR